MLAFTELLCMLAAPHKHYPNCNTVCMMKYKTSRAPEFFE
ncbi:hypothetical protein APHNP_0385 [Anaplasma phagocytophilum str. ApNP]|uniref:Uncharacterized protein n=2 Tax=Anaplasma phagocytophilum TaxID=948 RepID=A0A0F3NLK3_ANAPH|nr:hypothetical protein APHMUC_0589 [Anaplasma phagocytophilum str. ApMUC09]KJV67774.1 hypothetical protein APHNP_0385 [Anaplasma phagocytophilum str. ApNP]